jgi:hypothetical protein
MKPTPEKVASDIYNECLYFVHKGDSTVSAESLAKSLSYLMCDRIIEGVERAFDEYEKATGAYVKNRIFYWDFYSDVKSIIRRL